MITRGMTYLATNTLPIVVMESTLPLLPVGRYLLKLTTHFYHYIPRNVSIVRYGVSFCLDALNSLGIK